MNHRDEEATLPCPCYHCPKIIAYAAVGSFGTYHLKVAEGATQISADKGVWLFECSCGRRSKMTAPGWDDDSMSYRPTCI